ncbi:hypothetical protein ACQ4PT_009171 [Festuca glaucescens]
MAQFLQAVGELARGAAPTPSVVPVRQDDDLLPRLPQLMAAVHKPMAGLSPKRDFALLDVIVPSSRIRCVRAEFDAGRDSERQQPCTVFEAVVALLWQCRTRAAVISADDSDETAVMLWFAGNVHGLVRARRGYYGNCVVMQTVAATRGVVANGAVADVARLIRSAKDRIPDLLHPTDGSGSVAVDTEAEKGMPSVYNTLGLSSWRNLGVREWEGDVAQRGDDGAQVCRVPSRQGHRHRWGPRHVALRLAGAL